MELDPNDKEVLSALGFVYAFQRNYDKAIDYAKKALDWDRNYVSAWSLPGNIYAMQGDEVMAVDSFKKALKIAPNDESTWNQFGNAWYSLENYTEAVKCYEKAIQLDRNPPRRKLISDTLTAVWKNTTKPKQFSRKLANGTRKVSTRGTVWVSSVTTRKTTPKLLNVIKKPSNFRRTAAGHGAISATPTKT